MGIDLGPPESLRVRGRLIAAIIVGILAVLVLIAFGFQLAFSNRIDQKKASARAFPTPAVIPDERAQRLALEARQRRDLRGANGRMPIDAAMKAIAAKSGHAFDPIGGAP